MTAPTDQPSSAGADVAWWQGLPGALRAPDAADRLVRDYVDHSAAEDLAERGADELVSAVASHVEAGTRRAPRTAVVRALERGPGTTVEVVTDDMPFLVDSLTSALTVMGHGIVSVAHPRLAASRDADGALLDLRPADGVVVDHGVEAWIRIEVDGRLEPQERRNLEQGLSSVLDDVRAAVRDWPSMQDRALEAADELLLRPAAGGGQEQVAARFLRWLADDRFTFLGYGDHELGPDGTLELLPATGLGLLAPEGDDGTRAARLSASLPRTPTTSVLRVVKAGVRATVHRSAHVDGVCVPLRDADGRVTGERRFLGLFTSGAYSESVRRVPLVAEKVAEVLRRAGFAPGGHSARDLQNILEFFPRDELMQAEVDEVLRTALGVLSLQERRRTRLFLRADASGYTSCLVFLPRDRYTTTVGQDIEALLTGALDGGSAEHTLHVTESALARLHVVVRPRPGERLHPATRPGSRRRSPAPSARGRTTCSTPPAAPWPSRGRASSAAGRAACRTATAPTSRRAAPSRTSPARGAAGERRRSRRPQVDPAPRSRCASRSAASRAPGA
jgi:glutamate dehydrogenase